MKKSRTNRPLAVMLAAAMTAGFAGCKPGRAVRSGVVVDNGVKPVERPQRPASPESGLGTVMGFVRWKGKAPKRSRIDMAADLVCRIAGGEGLTEEYVVKAGGLANVYVYVKDGPPEAMKVSSAVQEPVLLEQAGCRFSPHVVAVMRGGTVEFRNSDGTRHSFEVGGPAGTAFEMTQEAKGAPEQRRFDVPAVMTPVQGRSHPWMNAFLNVSATPLFAVTDSTGRFDLSGLPPGTYTLVAVHERLGEQLLQVTVASKSQSSAEFIYTAR